MEKIMGIELADDAGRNFKVGVAIHKGYLRRFVHDACHDCEVIIEDAKGECDYRDLSRFAADIEIATKVIRNLSQITFDDPFRDGVFGSVAKRLVEYGWSGPRWDGTLMDGRTVDACPAILSLIDETPFNDDLPFNQACKTPSAV